MLVLFTDIFLRSLKRPSRDHASIDYRDVQLPGLLVRKSRRGYVTFYVWGRKLPPYGRPNTLKLGRYGDITLREARHRAKQILMSGSNGTYCHPNAESVGDALTSYITTELRRQCKSPEERIRVIERDIRPRLCQFKIGAIRKSDIIALRDDWATSRGPSAANHAFAELRCFFNWVERNREIDRNPCSKLRKPFSEHPRVRVLQIDELGKVWRATLEGSTVYNKIIRMLFLTGCRRYQVAEARWDEFDIKQRIWTLPPARLKTQRQCQRIYINDTMLALIQQQIGNRSQYLFPSNTLLSPYSAFSKGQDQFKAQSETAHWTLHDIRRTVATLMARELKIQPHVIETLQGRDAVSLGPSSKPYNHYDYFDECKDACLKWEAFLLALPPSESFPQINSMK